MSEALAVIDVPAVLPKGVTRRQWRLALLLPRAESAAQALRQAGYSASTINGKPGRQTGLVGVKRATEAIAALQADRARGLLAAGNAALSTVTEDLKQLDPRDRLAAGIKFIETAHAIGENVTQEGNADAWRSRQRRAMRLAYRMGYRMGYNAALKAAPPTT